MNKRRHRRIAKTMSLEYQVKEGEEAESQGQGTLKDISFGGIYFKCNKIENFRLGQIITFDVISKNPSYSSEPPCVTFRGQGKVIRIDPPEKGSSFYGVAVEFLEILDPEKMIQQCKE
jgi:c-di-GMP-binding flagellar brake protein YcgR